VTSPDLFLVVAAALVVLGVVRLVLTTDLVRQVLALNVASAGVLLVLVTVAARSDPDRPDPVPHALVLTGIVVTVSVTAVALGLVRRVEAAAREDATRPPDDGRSDAGPDGRRRP
jgi:multicomponent Na+:H+ antiporter subunit C